MVSRVNVGGNFFFAEAMNALNVLFLLININADADV